MKWGRREIHISAKALPLSGDNKRLEVSVDDDGPGIPEDKAREVLQRGKRLDETKPGTGLGLAIVADLVKEYGGVLRLERSRLGGLRASVELTSVE